MTHFLYALRCGEFVKIGRSKNPEKRLQQLRTASPYPCEIMGTIKEGPHYESRVHQMLRGHLHIGREWFRLEGAVLEFIATLTPFIERTDGRKIPRSPEMKRRISDSVLASDLRRTIYATAHQAAQRAKREAMA